MTPSRRHILKGTAALGALASVPHPVLGRTVTGLTAPDKGWRLPKTRPFKTIEHQWIAMADGVRLSARFWIPENAEQEPVPVVLEYIPYRKRDLYRFLDSAWGAALASHGIAFARVDIRGTGDSEGVITDEYMEAELKDAETIVAWLATQPWCSGAVGMRGISWGGINALQTAARRPPALKAIMAMACTDNRFTDDAHYIGGALGRTNFQWGTLFKSVMAGPPDPEIVGEAWETMWRERLDAAPAILSKWAEHQSFDSYWQRGSVSTDYRAIDVPTYLVAGWQDTYANPVCRLLSNLTCPRKGLIGPWGHIYPNLTQIEGLDWAFEEIRWWSHWLKGQDTGVMDDPALKAFVPYETAGQTKPESDRGYWMTADTWPIDRSQPLTFHLNTDGLSNRKGPENGQAIPNDHIVGLAKPEWLDRPPGEQSSDDAHSLTFDSPLLTEDLDIIGAPVLSIKIKSDQPIAHVAARLCEVMPDGQSWLVSYGLMNLTHRDSHETPEPLTPGEWYTLRLACHTIAHRFSKASRIRVGLSPSLWPLVWPSPQTPALSIMTGASTLQLPIRPQTPNDVVISKNTPANEDTNGSDPSTERPQLDAARGITLTEDTPEMAVTIPEIGTEIIRQRSQSASMIEGQASSCNWSETRKMTWSRNQWNCTVEADYALSADPDSFNLTERVRAYKNGKRIFERTHAKKIPRRLV